MTRTQSGQPLIPHDKHLDPARTAALRARGEPSIHTGVDLTYIGMPVGGLTSGQLYIGGDGRLWGWDIFNDLYRTIAEHYAAPLTPRSSLEQGFSLRCTLPDGREILRPLSSVGFPGVRFHGQYPIATVTYADPDVPVVATLEAFSPFVPLNVDDSSLPATMLHFALRNVSDRPVDVELIGWLQNAAARITPSRSGPSLTNRILHEPGARMIHCSAAPAIQADADAVASRPDIPLSLLGIAGKENDPVGAVGEAPPSRDLVAAFTIERDFINLLIAGPDDLHRAAAELHVDTNRGGVRWSTGDGTGNAHWESWDVRGFVGQTGVVRLIDLNRDRRLQVQRIEQSDTARRPLPRLADYPQVGDMTLALLHPRADDRAWAAVVVDPATGAVHPTSAATRVTADPGERPIGAMARKLTVAPGESSNITFAIAWHFPNVALPLVKIQTTRHYATRFDSSLATVRHLAENLERLAGATRLWCDTWYDSTLPWWLLDRTLASVSTLATSTVYRLADGRFYGWEGVGFCAGTCTHVWSYEQAMGRLFPELDRLLRQRVDFAPGVGFVPESGMVRFRGELAGPAVDGQAGTILRAYRDHLTSPDDAFLRRYWESIKQATWWLIGLDDDRDGIIQGAQHNTLDASWHGAVAWLSGHYQAALRAAQAMASEVGDHPFAQTCGRIADRGAANLVSRLYNGEYFINHPDPAHPQAINSGSGCHIDQVLGQSWAHQVNLPRITPGQETRSALAALWKYNFAPDVGPYRAANAPGRWFAMPGEAGLLMCTFPRDDWNYRKAAGDGPEWATGYFNECMSGFEHQVAAHMIWEGLVDQGLAIERAIHDRYHPSKRNPYNEIEAGDHYARAMASYGAFLAACGFGYHGPRGEIAFAPRLNPENFRAAFTAAEGWGSYAQTFTPGGMTARLELRHGKLRLGTITLTPPEGTQAGAVALRLEGRDRPATFATDGATVRIELEQPVQLTAGQSLDIAIGCRLPKPKG